MIEKVFEQEMRFHQRPIMETAFEDRYAEYGDVSSTIDVLDQKRAKQMSFNHPGRSLLLSILD
jgi:hypothetical protein